MAGVHLAHPYIIRMFGQVAFRYLRQNVGRRLRMTWWSSGRARFPAYHQVFVTTNGKNNETHTLTHTSATCLPAILNAQDLLPVSAEPDD